MSLLLSFIPAFNHTPGTVPVMTSYRGVSERIKMFDLLIKKAGNDGPQLKKAHAYAREIAAVKAERKVSLQASVFGKVCGTSNRMPSASATRPTAAQVMTTLVAPPAAAVQEVSVSRPASLTSAPSQAEAKSEPAVAQASSASTLKVAPSLLTRVKQQFTQTWSSLKHSFSSLMQTYRLHQSENKMHFENVSRKKSETCSAISEIKHAYQKNPLSALSLYNAAKQEIIFDAINDIIEKAKKENAEIDMYRLCEQANHYAVNSGVNALLFTLTKNNTIERTENHGLHSMQQRMWQVKEDISSKQSSSATLRRSSQNLNGRQRANSIQSTAQKMINDAYAKLFNDIESDPKNIYGTRHSFDRNEMRAALLEGQPALAGSGTRSAS